MRRQNSITETSMQSNQFRTLSVSIRVHYTVYILQTLAQILTHKILGFAPAWGWELLLTQTWFCAILDHPAWLTIKGEKGLSSHT